MGQILFPFISTGLTLVMAYGAMFPNNPIDMVPYLIYMVIVGIAMCTVYIALMKFVFRIDVSKIANFKTEGGAPAATREQKIGLIFFLIFIIIMLAMSLAPAPIKHFLEKFGLIGTVLIGSCVVALMKNSDGTPLIDLEKSFHMCNWGQITMVGYIMVVSQYMMGADAGISAAMAKLIMPFMALPPIVFLAVALAIGVVLTNVANNMMCAILCMPFLVNFGAMVGMNPIAMVCIMFILTEFALATPAASPVTGVAFSYTNWVSSGKMMKYGILLSAILFVVFMCIGFPIANFIFG
jgi:di/tricarboxylate transporter